MQWGVIPIEVVRIDRPSPVPNPSPANNPTAETPSPKGPMKSERQDNPAPDDSVALPKVSPSTDPSLSFTTSTASIAPSDFDLSNLDLAGSLTGDSPGMGLTPAPGPVAQARSSLAGVISHGSAAPATAAGAPATTRPVTAPAAPPPASGAATALAAAVGQSLGDGVRPMTMLPQGTGILRPGGGHTSGSISPDTGSGGDGPPNGTPPALTSSTFTIQDNGMVNGIEQYTTVPSTIPVSAVASLTASLTGTTMWSWSNNVASFTGYSFSTPAGQSQFPASQAPATAPVTTNAAYSFIVGPTGSQNYTVTCTATYPNGSGKATLTFSSSAAPTGSISVTPPLGSQTWSSVAGPDGGITLMLSPPINLNFKATNNTNTGGQFALMQIITYNKTTFTAANTTWYRQNNIDYTPTGGPNFNGNLVDNGAAGKWDYPFAYSGSDNLDSLPVTASQAIPATGVNNPTTSDEPASSTPNTGSRSQWS